MMVAGREEEGFQPAGEIASIPFHFLPISIFLWPPFHRAELHGSRQLPLGAPTERPAPNETRKNCKSNFNRPMLSLCAWTAIQIAINASHY